ncbi:MAG: hypothetical protein KatS3mg022_0432 [Armatimonadota bacterium]|nr:MAG: hypothetical protein KatS3mg022_0432 [Armatimonadota bacterium]
MNRCLTWDDVLTQLRQHSGVKHGLGCDESAIQAAEQTLVLCFPNSYKQFLLSVGWLDLEGDEIFGLGTDLPEQYMDVVWATTKEREIIHLPDSFIVVSQTYRGNLICLDTADMHDQECPVLFVSFCPSADIKILANSFVEFVRACLAYGAEYLTEALLNEAGESISPPDVEPVSWREHRQVHYEDAQRLFERYRHREQYLIQWGQIVGRPWTSAPIGFAKEARDFLLAHSWCRTVRSLSLRKWVEGIFALFYAEIEPEPGSGADEAVWVIVGDLPPAYIDVFSATTAREALEAYMGLLEEWVEAVRVGEPLDELMPIYHRYSLVPVPPTLRFAEMMSLRLQFLQDLLNNL